MDTLHVFLVNQQPINLINNFITKGQMKLSQEFNISLRSLSNSKAIHLGSLTVRPHDQIELKTRPPNLVKVTLQLSLADQFLHLNVTLDPDELSHHTITPTRGLRLHHRSLNVTKYDRIQDRPIYSDIVMIKPTMIMLFNRNKNEQNIFTMSYNLISEICYISAPSKLSDFEVNTQESLKNNPLIDDLQTNKHKQDHLFPDTTMNFTPVILPPRPHIRPHPTFPQHQTKYKYPPEVRHTGRSILRTSIQHPAPTTSSPPVLTPSIPGSPIHRSPFQTPPSLHQQGLQITDQHPVGASSLAPSPITTS